MGNPFRKLEWIEEGEQYGWAPPPPAVWPLRLPVIRHVRALWHSYRADSWAGQWGSVGIGTGRIAGSDLWVLRGIWRGFA